MSEESQDPILEQEQGEAVEEQEEEPGEAEQTEITPTDAPRGRPRLNEEDKRDRRRKTQQAYYAKVRAKAAPPPEPPKPILKAPKPTPKRTSAPKRVLVPRVEYEPSSPRSNLISAYREARIQQVERRQAMYSSWLE